MDPVIILDAWQVEQCARHEAGHAICAWRLGVPIASADLTLVITQPRGRSPSVQRSRAVIALGGPMAEDAYRGYTLEEQHALWGSVWSVDLSNALARLPLTDSVASALQQARGIVREHWSLIELVAQALTSRGRLTGAEIARLIRSEEGIR